MRHAEQICSRGRSKPENLISKHDTTEGNRLSLEGSLSHYRELAATDPRQAWNDLYHMGYRSNLTVGHGYDNEVHNLPLPAKRFQGCPVLPELTTKALTSLNFYLSAAHLSSGVPWERRYPLAVLLAHPGSG